MEINFNIRNKVVLITGGYGYLGKEISFGLARKNAIVIVLSKSESKFNTVFEGIDNVFFQQCDISDTQSVQVAYKNVFNKYGSIDVLINNAFYLDGQNPINITDEQWSYSMDGLVGSVYRCIREVIPFFEKKAGGKIINISSMYGVVSPDFSIYKDHPQMLNPPHYGVGKAGVIHMTKYFANFLASKNIYVNAISPGPFPSLTVQENKFFIKELIKKVPLGRIGNPKDLIGPIVFLASKDSNYITGQNLVVDGGWTIK